MADLFARPIPGQSLTDTPKNSPWERPPEYVEVGDVVKHYVNRLANEDVMDDLAALFDMGGDLETIVETMMLSGSMKGLHTVEAGMLAGPVVGTFIKSIMDTYGVEVKESMVDPKEAKRGKAEKRLKGILKNYLKSNPQEDAGTELVEDMAAAEGIQEEEQETPEVEMQEEPMGEEMPDQEMQEKPQGLMAKGVES